MHKGSAHGGAWVWQLAALWMYWKFYGVRVLYGDLGGAIVQKAVSHCARMRSLKNTTFWPPDVL